MKHKLLFFMIISSKLMAIADEPTSATLGGVVETKSAGPTSLNVVTNQETYGLLNNFAAKAADFEILSQERERLMSRLEVYHRQFMARKTFCGQWCYVLCCFPCVYRISVRREALDSVRSIKELELKNLEEQLQPALLRDGFNSKDVEDLIRQARTGKPILNLEACPKELGHAALLEKLKAQG